MFGVLNINKPSGWTSRDVVNRVQRFVRPTKAGHAGTLDPLATGVLVVCVGPATKLISYVQQLPKEYLATFLLGRTSASEDTETEVTPLPTAPEPTLAEIETQLPNYLGDVQQRPPAYSALKVKGHRAYKLARQGQAVELESRTIQIYELNVTKFAYPELQLTIRCGSGTYVRSLGRDLAEALGTGAVMSALSRTAIGPYKIADALELEQLSSESLSENLLSPHTAVAHLPQLELNAEQANEIRHGRLIPSELKYDHAAATLAATNSAGQLLAILSERRPGFLGSTCNFISPA